MESMRTLTRPAAVVMFFALALVPLTLFGVNELWHGRRTLELGKQAAFPDKLAPNTFRRISDWFNDRIGLRYYFVQLGSDLNVRLLHLSINRAVTIGRDDWLFYTDDEDRPAVSMVDVRGHLRLALPQVQQIDDHLRSVSATFAACGKSAFVVIAPNKQSIYSEYLAAETSAITTRLDDLLQKLGPEAKAMIIDPRPRLRSVKSAHPFPLYLKTDTHWNDLGAFYVYQTIIEALARTRSIPHPEYASFDQYDIDVQPFQGGDLAVRMLFSPWSFPDELVILHPKPTLPAVSVSVVDDIHSIYRNPKGKGRIVLSGDSFSPRLAAFLAEHFEEVNHYNYTLSAFEDLAFNGVQVADAAADVAIVEVAERHLPILLKEPKQLARVCASLSGPPLFRRH
jgi:alginate O-acetyltransferase complex protein AlgJ